ncbi:MAG: response regulator [Pseudomonadota bacterium]
MSSILVIDDDEHVLEVISEMLRLEGHSVATAGDGRQAEREFDAKPFDLVITDIIMPEQEGLETISRFRHKNQHLPIIAISGGGRSGPDTYLSMAEQIGANASLTKPFDLSDLVAAVTDLLGTAGAR